MDTIFDLFEDFTTDNLFVADFGITVQGALVTNIINNNGKVEVWAGNPVEDKYAEQLVLDKSELDAILDEVCYRFE